MRNVLLLAGLILLLSGCTLTPESFALIPAPKHVDIPPSLRTLSSQCGPDEVMIAPGQAITDEASDTLAAHIDITEVNTDLSGETLAVVILLRDVPESLTFDRTGVPENAMEYMWEASIDVDNDLETGFDGFDYTLSASHFVFSPDSDRSITTARLGNKVQVDTWKSDVSPDGSYSYRLLERARIEVSTQANTITLVGDIPGITSESRLAIQTYDYFDGAEKVECHIPTPISENTHWDYAFDSDDELVSPDEDSDFFITLSTDQMENDPWLRTWAETVIGRDGAGRIIESVRHVNEDAIMALYMHSFAAAERFCSESREELASLIEAYAKEIKKDQEHIDFPLLAAANIMSSEFVDVGGRLVASPIRSSSVEGNVDCSNALDALAVIPVPITWCFTDNPQVNDPHSEDLICFNDTPMWQPDPSTESSKRDSDAMKTALGQSVADDASSIVSLEEGCHIPPGFGHSVFQQV